MCDAGAARRVVRYFLRRGGSLENAAEEGGVGGGGVEVEVEEGRDRGRGRVEYGKGCWGWVLGLRVVRSRRRGGRREFMMWCLLVVVGGWWCLHKLSTLAAASKVHLFATSVYIKLTGNMPRIV